MKIYFSCSITGGRDDQREYKTLVDALLDDGHSVPTAHLSNSDILALEMVVDPQEIYLRDTGWVKACDALVAEVTTPSHGVGYEIALAESLGKPIFCCYKNGNRVSKMILGNPSPLYQFCEYANAEDAIKEMRVFLKSVGNE